MRPPRPPRYEDPAEGTLSGPTIPPEPRRGDLLIGDPRYPEGAIWDGSMWVPEPPNVGAWFGLCFTCAISGFLVGILLTSLVWWIA